jgi:FSR family fosmidomycin resistance protein-like MFS transporter
MFTQLDSFKKSIMWLCVAHLVCDIYGGFINPLMPFIASKLGFSLALATLLIAITQICSNMLQPLFGFFADNVNKRIFVFWGLILSSIFIPLAPSAPNIYILTFFMILGSLGGSFFHPQAMGFVNVFSKENCANNMGLFVSLGSFGFALGPLLATYITQHAGLDRISFTSILGILVAMIMFLFVQRLSVTQVKPRHKKFIQTFKEILNNNQMKLLIVIATMKSIVTNCSCILLPFLWKSMGHSPFYIGIALFLFVFAGSIGSYFSPKLESILGSKKVLYISLWATFPMMIIFALVYKTMPAISMFLFGLIGFTTMLAQPVILVIAQKTLPEYKSIVAGFVNGFCWGIAALFLSGVGTVAEHFGIINTVLVITVIPALSSYLLKYLKES